MPRASAPAVRSAPKTQAICRKALIGKIPIYIARQGTKLEFDLNDYPVIFFRGMEELKDTLEKRLRGLAEARKRGPGRPRA